MRLAALVIVVVAFTLTHIDSSRAAVRVEDDEVIFSLRAPGAKNVFLVGNFNNWNPTLEKMESVGDRFEVYLFMLAGDYQYKFVVDGEWIADPDNPPSDPAQGSALVLEERAGTLVLGADRPKAEEGEPTLIPSIRYIGAFFLDDNKTSSKQSLDVYFDFAQKNISSSVDFKTSDDTWRMSPPSTTINFNRGYLDVKWRSSLIRAFENDTTWSSHDPAHLLGDVGVYNYSAGYGRKGVALIQPLVLNTTFRFLYSDRVEARLDGPVSVPTGDVLAFAGSTAPDTTVYHYAQNRDDEDALAAEFAADMGSLGGGYAFRRTRGLHSGLLSDITRDVPGFTVSARTTSEYWDAGVAWLTYSMRPGLDARVSYGVSDAEIRSNSASVSSVSTLGDIRIGQDTSPADQRTPFQRSSRWTGSLDYVDRRLFVTAKYEWSDFEFRPYVSVPSMATVNVATVKAGWSGANWKMDGALRYSDEDYGGTPQDFHYRTPARNFWLDGFDKLDPRSIAAFDLPRSTTLALTFSLRPREWLPKAIATNRERFSALVTLETTASEIVERLEYTASRIGVEQGFASHFYGQADARVAWYNKPSWGVREAFASFYVEAGYRNRNVELSLGVGLDPVVIDPVLNEYANIGREESLRSAILPGLRRDQSALLGSRLLKQERALEDNQSVKLELLVLF